MFQLVLQLFHLELRLVLWNVFVVILSQVLHNINIHLCLIARLGFQKQIDSLGHLSILGLHHVLSLGHQNLWLLLDNNLRLEHRWLCQGSVVVDAGLGNIRLFQQEWVCRFLLGPVQVKIWLVSASASEILSNLLRHWPRVIDLNHRLILHSGSPRVAASKIWRCRPRRCGRSPHGIPLGYSHRVEQGWLHSVDTIGEVLASSTHRPGLGRCVQSAFGSAVFDVAMKMVLFGLQIPIT